MLPILLRTPVFVDRTRPKLCVSTRKRGQTHSAGGSADLESPHDDRSRHPHSRLPWLRHAVGNRRNLQSQSHMDSALCFIRTTARLWAPRLGIQLSRFHRRRVMRVQRSRSILGRSDSGDQQRDSDARDIRCAANLGCRRTRSGAKETQPTTKKFTPVNANRQIFGQLVQTKALRLNYSKTILQRSSVKQGG